MSRPPSEGDAQNQNSNSFTSRGFSGVSIPQIANDKDLLEYELLSRTTGPSYVHALLKPFNASELCRFGRIHATQRVPHKRRELVFRPFSCRILVKNSYSSTSWSVERVTVTDIVMPADNEDVPPIPRYVKAEKYLQLAEALELRTSLRERLSDLQSRVEDAELYELQNLQAALGEIAI